MRQTSGAGRRSPRRGAKTTAIAIVLAGTGIVASGAAPAAGQQAVKPSLDYACAFPAGPLPVSVRVAATFPATGTAGQPIKPTGTGITVTLSPSVVSYLGTLSSATVRLSAALGVAVSENGIPATAPWQGLTSPLTPVPAQGSLVVATAAVVPPVTIKTAGAATFTAGKLSLLLRAYKTSGQATNPPSMLVGCTPKAGQHATLATIPVTGTTSPAQHGGITVGSQPGGSRTRAVAAGTPNYCPGIPKNGLKMNPNLPPPPKPPPGVIITHFPQPGCANVAGFSNVRKLNEAGLIGPGRTNLWIGATIYIKSPPKGNYVQADNVGQLDYHGLHEFPPATVTLLAFGFMPVTATLQLSLIGTLNAYAVGPESPGSCKTHRCTITVTTLYSRVALRIYNVKVNGVPLNVGPTCGTNPFVIKAVGHTPTYLVQFGGELTATVKIPPFKNCGVGENLDSIFTASVSGPGNDLLLTQGAPCFVVGGFGCPPCKVIPQRTVHVGSTCAPASGIPRAGRRHGH